MKTPPRLRLGDLVAIVSPASNIEPELVYDAARELERQGFDVRIMPHALGVSGSYSGTADERLADLQAAIDDPEVKAILCSRGGYGAAHLLDRLNVHRPVWLIGFSDISALHALWLHNGIRSIHSSMAKELALKRCCHNEANARLFYILSRGVMPQIEWPDSPYNIYGEAHGMLVGGNLAVINGLAATPYNPIKANRILFIEDVCEPIYKVERVLYRLRMAGVLDNLKGLIIGQFTGWQPSKDWQDMNTMIAQAVGKVPYPIAFNAPIGHIDGNMPLLHGARVTLSVTPSHSKLWMKN